MITYAVADGRLEITCIGETSFEDTSVSFARIQADNSVPSGLPMLVDARELKPTSLTRKSLEARVEQVVDFLGAKISNRWAIVIRDDRRLQMAFEYAETYAAMEFLTSVRIFQDIEEARLWLNTTLHEPVNPLVRRVQPDGWSG